MNLGPVACLPSALLRADVLLLVGEDPSECAPAAGWSHSYRGFHGAVVDKRLWLVTPFGSSAMEAVLWELLRPGTARRILLAGTAGALGGFSGPAMEPLRIDGARSILQCFDSHPNAVFEPSWNLPLPGTRSISTDRFYGFSPTAEGDMPVEPAMSEAWDRYGGDDAVVEMEVAAFYHFCRSLGGPELRYGAIKVVANDVADLDSLPKASAQAMRVATDAALACF